jgi:hypothetical protein
LCFVPSFDTLTTRIHSLRKCARYPIIAILSLMDHVHVDSRPRLALVHTFHTSMLT